MQKKLKTDNHTILKYNRSEQHKNQIDNLNAHILRGKNRVGWWYVPNVLGFTSKPDGFRQMCVWADSPDRYIQPLLLWVSNPSYMHAGNLGDFLDIWPCYIQTLVLRISYISRLHPTTALMSFKPILHAWNLEYPWEKWKISYVAMLHPNFGFEIILHIQVSTHLPRMAHS